MNLGFASTQSQIAHSVAYTHMDRRDALQARLHEAAYIQLYRYIRFLCRLIHLLNTFSKKIINMMQYIWYLLFSMWNIAQFMLRQLFAFPSILSLRFQVELLTTYRICHLTIAEDRVRRCEFGLSTMLFKRRKYGVVIFRVRKFIHYWKAAWAEKNCAEFTFDALPNRNPINMYVIVVLKYQHLENIQPNCIIVNRNKPVSIYRYSDQNSKFWFNQGMSCKQ